MNSQKTCLFFLTIKFIKHYLWQSWHLMFKMYVNVWRVIERMKCLISGAGSNPEILHKPSLFCFVSECCKSELIIQYNHHHFALLLVTEVSLLNVRCTSHWGRPRWHGGLTSQWLMVSCSTSVVSMRKPSSVLTRRSRLMQKMWRHLSPRGHCESMSAFFTICHMGWGSELYVFPC